MTTPPNSQTTFGNSNKYLLTIITIGLLFGAGFLINRNLYQKFNSQTNQSSEQQNTTELSDTNVTENNLSELPQPLLEASLSAPFTPQAPTANWDELHNEACEEAASIMVAGYFAKDFPLAKSSDYLLDQAFVENEITKLTEWQDQNFGYHLSIDTYETAKMIEAVYKLKAQVVPYNLQEIKRTFLDKNKIVIVPTDGRILKNPYYKPPGPIYHMLVITGYDATDLITNDPGTKRGYNYRYNQDTVEAATGNWNHDTKQIDLSHKLMIIVSP